MRLAIVGAGVGGCSAAYFTHRFIPSCEITVYESSDRIGGRVYGIDVDNQRVEIGAAFIKKSNQFLMGLLQELEIKATPIRVPSSTGVWNGERFIVKSSHSTLAAIRIFVRYPVNVVRLWWIVREVNRRNKIVYREVKNRPGEWDELFAVAGITEWLGRPLRDVLLERGVGSNFIDDVVEPITRVIYNQDSSINAYAGLFAVNALNGRSYKIDSGNEVLPKRLLEASEAALELGAEVESIVRGEDGSYEVSGRGFSEKFDSVIIANNDFRDLKTGTGTPMEFSSKEFQKVFVQIVRGDLSKSYFNLPLEGSLPNTIVSTKGVPFTHLIKIESDGEHPVYSIASTTPIENYLNDVFEKPEVILQHAWSKAYPILEPISKMPKCELDTLVFYSNCSESALSAMEASILSAFNSVQLFRRKFGDN